MRAAARVTSGALFAVLILALPTSASAHRLAPSLLQLIENEVGVSVLWKTPLEQPTGSNLRPVLPASCQVTAPAVAKRVDSAVTLRWSVDCGSDGLTGATLSVEGLDLSRTDAIVRVVLRDGRAVSAALSAGRSEFTIPERQTVSAVASEYARLGFEHILTGLDHLLFVAGLLFLVGAGRRVITTVTAFTVGHSLTLSLAALGVVAFPTDWVEVVIAGSLYWLAVELSRRAEDRSVWGRRPWALAAGFGLLHGFGFAGALAEVGLPSDEIPLALAAFNGGIELGQLAFILSLLAVWKLAGSRVAQRSPSWERVPSYAIGSLAVFWLLDRTAAAL